MTTKFSNLINCFLKKHYHSIHKYTFKYTEKHSSVYAQTRARRGYTPIHVFFIEIYNFISIYKYK